MLYPLPVLEFYIKGAAKNGRNPLSLTFPALMTPFPVITFINEEVIACINEEVIGAINEAAIGAIIARRNPRFWYFLFHVLLFH